MELANLPAWLPPFVASVVSDRPEVSIRERYNFGDWLSPFIVSLLIDGPVRYNGAGQAPKLLSTGSVLFAVADGDRVWGSGLLHGKMIDRVAGRSVTYRAVRGPRTAEALRAVGLSCPDVFGDPALLLPHLIENDLQKKYRVGIVPHFSDLVDLSDTRDPAVRIIDVRRNLVTVVRDILSCEVVLSTSLHGVIVAEAYGIPAALAVHRKPVHGDMFKYEDYFQSTDRDARFIESRSLDELLAFRDSQLFRGPLRFDPAPLMNACPFPSTRSLEGGPEFRWSQNLRLGRTSPDAFRVERTPT